MVLHIQTQKQTTDLTESSYCFPKFGTEGQKFRLNELEASKSKYEPPLVLKNKFEKVTVQWSIICVSIEVNSMQ